MADLSGTGDVINAPGEVEGVKRDADGNIVSIDSLTMGPSDSSSYDDAQKVADGTSLSSDDATTASNGPLGQKLESGTVYKRGPDGTMVDANPENGLLGQRLKSGHVYTRNSDGKMVDANTATTTDDANTVAGGSPAPASSDASMAAGQGAQNAKQSDAQTVAKTPAQLGIDLTPDQKEAIQGTVGKIAKSQAELEEQQNILNIQRQGFSQQQSVLQDARDQLPKDQELAQQQDFVKDATNDDTMVGHFGKTVSQIKGERRPSSDDIARLNKVYSTQDSIAKIGELEGQLAQNGQNIQLTDAKLQALQTMPQQDPAQAAQALAGKYVRENATKKISSLRRDYMTVAQQERQGAAQEKAVAKMGTPEYSKATEDVDTLGTLEDRKSKYDAALGTLANRARAKVGMDPSLGDATPLTNKEQEQRAALRSQFGLGESDTLDAKKYDQLRADAITAAKGKIGTAEKTKQKNAIASQISDLERVAGVSADQIDPAPAGAGSNGGASGGNDDRESAAAALQKRYPKMSRSQIDNYLDRASK